MQQNIKKDIFFQNKARRKFCKCKNWYKNRIEIVFLADSYKNPFDRKSPATCGSSFQSFSKPSAYNQVLFHKTCWSISILTYVFSSRDLLIHKYLRFLARILLWRIVSCFVLLKWVEGGCMRNVRNVKGICGQVALLLVILNLIQDL